jgi:hypothetical protein
MHTRFIKLSDGTFLNLANIAGTQYVDVYKNEIRVYTVTGFEYFYDNEEAKAILRALEELTDWNKG